MKKALIHEETGVGFFAQPELLQRRETLMVRLKRLRIHCINGTIKELPNVVEYLCGFQFFFYRLSDGTTISIPRADLFLVQYWNLGAKTWWDMRWKNPKPKRERVIDGGTFDEQ